MDLIAAAKTYAGNVGPTNRETDQYLRKDKLPLPASWVIGTRIVYEAPGKGFTDSVRAGDFVFEVPEEYKGLKETALVMEGNDFDVEIRKSDGRYTFMLIGKVTGVVENFPATSGRYCIDEATGIPHGEHVPIEMYETDTVRYLFREENGPYVGAVVRSDNVSGLLWPINGRRYVLVNIWPGVNLHVARFIQAEPEPEHAALMVRLAQLGVLLRCASEAEQVIDEPSFRKEVSPEKRDLLRRLVERVREIGKRD